MKLKQLIIFACCVLLFAQCASLRKSESQSWSKAKKEWESGGEKQRVNTAPVRDNRQLADQKTELEIQPQPALPQYSKELFLGLISEEMWEELFPNRLGRGTNSDENDFYSFEAFKEATKHFPRFLNEGNEAARRRELAAFLAHLAQETGYFRYLEQLTVARSYSVSNKEYPPVEGKEYYGRGPIQLSYNYNYGQFSKAYFGDKNVLLKNPELLATDSVVSFGSAIWFWMTMQPPKPACHDVMVGNWNPVDVDDYANRKPGFGLTLNIINASQCGKQSEHADKRYAIYDSMCKYFGTTKGKNCDCIDQLPYGKYSW
ncbi:MAG: chitinase [Prevotellaceae bacterium]|jgi:hypothetical protein|nr:chitinase [Prevotellaceae bacterium]